MGGRTFSKNGTTPSKFSKMPPPFSFPMKHNRHEGKKKKS
jgi:hypothetical protein